jgi:hypothetical protein
VAGLRPRMGRATKSAGRSCGQGRRAREPP